MSHRAIRVGLFAVVMVVAGFVGVGPAQAHDRVLSTVPAAGATVAAPAEVVLNLDEPALALGTKLRVEGPDGRDVVVGVPRLLNTEVHQALAGDLAAGAYTVDWRITSFDGHPVSGRFAFTVAASAAPTTSATSTAPTAAVPSPSATTVLSPSVTAAAVPSSSTVESRTSRGVSTSTVAGIAALVLILGLGVAFVGIRFGRRPGPP